MNNFHQYINRKKKLIFVKCIEATFNVYNKFKNINK